MKRTVVKSAILEAVEKIGLKCLWQDKPCKLFVIVAGNIRVIELGKVRSHAAFERVMGRVQGWGDLLDMQRAV